MISRVYMHCVHSTPDLPRPSRHIERLAWAARCQQREHRGCSNRHRMQTWLAGVCAVFGPPTTPESSPTHASPVRRRRPVGSRLLQLQVATNRTMHNFTIHNFRVFPRVQLATARSVEVAHMAEVGVLFGLGILKRWRYPDWAMVAYEVRRHVPLDPYTYVGRWIPASIRVSRVGAECTCWRGDPRPCI